MNERLTQAGQIYMLTWSNQILCVQGGPLVSRARPPFPNHSARKERLGKGSGPRDWADRIASVSTCIVTGPRGIDTRHSESLASVFGSTVCFTLITTRERRNCVT